MDSSIGNMANDNIPDKVTIKVKVAGEDYHDLVIDWSDASGPYKGQQVIHQLSSITGIPVKCIQNVLIVNPTDSYTDITNVEKQGFNADHWTDEFTKEICFGCFNDGDSFAIAEDLFIRHLNDGEFGLFTIRLCSRVLFSDDRCTYDYCHYANNRAFLNRQIAIATNSELLRKLNEVTPYIDNQIMRVFKFYRDLNIRQFINHRPPYCSSGAWVHYVFTPRTAAVYMPHYSRTRG